MAKSLGKADKQAEERIRIGNTLEYSAGDLDDESENESATEPIDADASQDAHHTTENP